MGKPPTLVPAEKLEKLKKVTQDLIKQEPTHYTIKELIRADFEGIESALKKHPYNVVAEKISEAIGINLSGGTLKKYVSDIKKQAQTDTSDKTKGRRKKALGGSQTGETETGATDVATTVSTQPAPTTPTSGKPHKTNIFNPGELPGRSPSSPGA